MKIVARIVAALLLIAALTGCGAGVSEGDRGQSVELFAASVGKGDAIIIKVDNWCGLIDAGRPKAMSRVRAALRRMGVTALDAVFLTHTDNDHAGGLAWLAESDIPVGTWYASGLYTGVKAKKHPAALAAGSRGAEAQWLRRGDVVELGDIGATLEVLAPFQLFEDKDDNNSLVMMLKTDQGNVLLTGDMELPEEAALLSQGDDLSCVLLKAPNHGDDDTVSEAFAQACKAQAALISTDSREKPGTPDAGVLSRLAAAGTVCYVTQDAALGLWAKLTGGKVEVTAVGIDAPMDAVTLLSAVPGDDLITLRNDGGDCDMTGWSLYSDRGGELFAFPDGCTLPAGATIVVGTHSSDGGYDLLWDDKKVVHRSKTDNITLYDGWGRTVDVVDNGL